MGCDAGHADSGDGFASFNPRTRVGCDVAFSVNNRADKIVSIHAPAWGATHRVATSIHATMFQSTHPRGVRRIKSAVCFWTYVVSIHAPAWGATVKQKLNQEQKKGFNPRTRVGCDPQAYQDPVGIWTFQSTHPRGVRPIGTARLSCEGSFNPRTRVGCDPRLSRCSMPSPRFNPRTRVGCDFTAVKVSLMLDRVSIHAPAWGATARPTGPWWGPCAGFNPRTRVGCDCFHVLSSRFP